MVRGAVHIDMDEVALRRCRLLFVAEERDFKFHAGATDMSYAQARRDSLRESDFLEVATRGFHYQANYRAALQIEHTGVNQIAIHHGVEIAVVSRVVDMAVTIVIHPARLDFKKMRKAGPSPRLRASQRLTHQFRAAALEMRSMLRKVVGEFGWGLRRNEHVANPIIDGNAAIV